MPPARVNRSLRRTLIGQILVTGVCLLLLSATAVWGVRGLSQDWSVAVRGYEQLRDVYEIAAHVTTARTLMSLPQPQTTRALVELESARTKVEIERDPLSVSSAELTMVKQHLAAAQAAVERSIQQRTPLDPQPLLGVIGATSSAASALRLEIEQAQRRADTRQRFTVIAVASAGAALLIAAVIFGVMQYRSIMQPITRLQRGVAAIAGGDFSTPLAAAGPRELADLAADFNAMASQLHELYRDLEQQVRDKSRELARSQHLASIGFLAAGVAHEINNPLGIITGFAELTLQQLRDGGDSAARATIEPALRAICDEAFRCKRITEQLLSMSARPEQSRKRVDLVAIVNASLARLSAIQTLPPRQVRFDPPAGPVFVRADDAQLNQLLLNLLTNAAEALPVIGGTISVDLRADGPHVSFSIRDNGCGMSETTRARAFEPFFTRSRDGHRGTGLGLAISQAIAESHGGSIRAESPGEGAGSTFTVSLPAAKD